MHEPSWTGRPRLAAGVRALVLAVPLLAAGGAAWLTAVLVPGPYAERLVAVVAAGLLVGAALERLSRRLLPLPALLGLSLVFPDEAPNRLRVALRAGSTRDLMTAARRPRGTGAQEAALHTVELLGALARHDAGTRRHSERVRAYTDLLAAALGIPEPDRARLRWAALLHDLGKVTVTAEVLGKSSPLEDGEWESLRLHPSAGADLAGGLAGFLGPWFDTIEQHHERWDGTGYPRGLVGEQICLGARIVAVADSFEVMTSGRSYQQAKDPATARAELVRYGGRQFDPTVVRGLLEVSLGDLGRWRRPLGLAVTVPFAGVPSSAHDPVGLAGASALHPVTHTHAAVIPSGHDAGGSLHPTGHAHDGGAGAGVVDQR